MKVLSANTGLVDFNANLSELYPGGYQKKILVGDEVLYVRMEMLNENNSKHWVQFRDWSYTMANDSRGVISTLMLMASRNLFPSYQEVQKFTEFTLDEHEVFKKKCEDIATTDRKIVHVLRNSACGCIAMNAHGCAGEQRFITYITNNESYNIEDVPITPIPTLKKYIDFYKDLLIAVGSDFSKTESFHNRGIFRNPFWVVEKKFSGLSMILHGFSGLVAKEHFPSIKHMHVIPVGSMQKILSSELKRGEGQVVRGDSSIDICDEIVKADDPEGELNIISVEALERIFLEKTR